MKNSNKHAFVKAFVGAIGKDAQELDFTFPSFLSNTNVQVFEHDFYKIFTFGQTKNTLRLFKEDAPFIIVKGRPFYLDNQLNLSSFKKKNQNHNLINLDGKFSIFSQFDKNTFLLATDFIGAGGIYYFYDIKKKILFFSTHLGFLISAIKRKCYFNQLGIVSLIIARGSIGGMTPFQKIYKLSASEALNIQILDNNNPEISHIRYASPAYNLQNDLDYSNNKINSQVFADILDKSLRRENFDGNVGLMLSCGFDSQLLGLSIKQGEITPFQAFSYGIKSSQQVIGARYSAQAMRVRHRLLESSDWDFSTYASKVLSIGGGIIGLGAAKIDAFINLPKEINTVITGLFGDAVSGAHLSCCNQNNIDKDIFDKEVLSKTVANSNIPIKQIYSQEIAELYEIIDKIREENKSLKPYQKDFLVDLVIRQGSWISNSFEIAELLTETQVSYPLYNRELIKFFFNLPYQNLCERRFYKEHLYELRKKMVKSILLRPIKINNCLINSKIEFPRKLFVKITESIGFKTQQINWPHDFKFKIKKSLPWLRTQIENIEDRRLHDICTQALDRSLKGHQEDAAIFHSVIPAIMAKSFSESL